MQTLLDPRVFHFVISDHSLIDPKGIIHVTKEHIFLYFVMCVLFEELNFRKY